MKEQVNLQKKNIKIKPEKMIPKKTLISIIYRVYTSIGKDISIPEKANNEL